MYEPQAKVETKLLPEDEDHTQEVNILLIYAVYRLILWIWRFFRDDFDGWVIVLVGPCWYVHCTWLLAIEKTTMYYYKGNTNK